MTYARAGDSGEGGARLLRRGQQRIGIQDQEEAGLPGHAAPDGGRGRKQAHTERHPGGSGHFHVRSEITFVIVMFVICVCALVSEPEGYGFEC